MIISDQQNINPIENNMLKSSLYIQSIALYCTTTSDFGQGHKKSANIKGNWDRECLLISADYVMSYKENDTSSVTIAVILCVLWTKHYPPPQNHFYGSAN